MDSNHIIYKECNKMLHINKTNLSSPNHSINMDNLNNSSKQTLNNNRPILILKTNKETQCHNSRVNIQILKTKFNNN